MCSKPMNSLWHLLNLGTTFHLSIVDFFDHRVGPEVINRDEPLSSGVGIFAYQKPNPFFLVQIFWSRVCQTQTIIWILTSHSLQYCAFEMDS